MADIQLRFHHDMLVLSTPIESQLARIGIDAVRDNELTLLLEPEVLDEIYALESAAGAQCIVADTAFMTPARLAHSGMRENAAKLAEHALNAAAAKTPQHILVELGPCGLPLDASSKASLNENRDQYKRAAETFADREPLFDAYFLNGFTSCTDLKCALMGMRKVTDKPIFASVDIAVEGEGDADATPAAGASADVTPADVTPAAINPAMSAMTLGGKGRETLGQAVAVMAEYGAQVTGFQTAASPDYAARLVREACEASFLPVLAQLRVRDINPEQNAPTEANPYYEPDVMVDAADILKAAGAQFLRAAGNATPSYTGALVAATVGDSVTRPTPFSAAVQTSTPSDPPSELAERLRKRINEALGN